MKRICILKRPLQNAPFRPISASGLNFNPQNTQCIPAVKILAFLELERNWTSCKGLNVMDLFNMSKNQMLPRR